MELSNDRVIELTWKYLRGDLTEIDRKELELWLENPYNRARFTQRIDAKNILEGITMLEAAQKEVHGIEWSPEDQVGKAEVILLNKNVRRGGGRFYTIAAAAVLVAAVGVAVLWKISYKEKPSENKTRIASIGLPPGGNRAVLTLADGTTVNLDDAKQGQIAKQGGSDVVKDSDGQVSYRKGDEGRASGFNIITTPRGGQYRVALPDGSLVWLDAESSLKFPTSFSGNERSVVLEGQGYFETVKDAMHPFIVMAGKMQIKVLGTSFDIMAYANEQTTDASLVTGSIAVTGGGKRVILQPEEQSRIDKAGIIKTGKFDPEQVLAWKNGFLEFNQADIQTVMRTVSRWWDLDVRYEAATDMHTFTGQLSKDLDANEALKILTTSGYHFKIEGNVITVLP